MSSTLTSKKRKTAAVLVLVLLAVALVVWVAAVASGGPKIRVTISKKTTYITEPLRPDGYPDYLAAVNQRQSKGATPENNSAVLFIKAVGPSSIPVKMRGQYFKMLGVPPLPVEGDYLIDSDNFIKREQQAERLPPNVDDSKVREHFTTAQTHPWSEKEFPEVARWLKSNEKPLAILVEAAKRSRRYDPYVCIDDCNLLFGTLLPMVQQSREVVRLLTTRAMLRMRQGDRDGAWQDILACHRFARLVGQGMCFVEYLVAISMDNMAMTAERALLNQPNLTSKQIVGKMFIDWDVPLRMSNDWCDRLAAAARKPTYAERLRANQEIGDGCLLYSVGSNGRDDGGERYEDSESTTASADWDDIAVRLGQKNGSKK